MTPSALGRRAPAPSDGVASRAGTRGGAPRRVRFGEAVVLSKGEVFAACQALADADRVLGGAGRDAERSGLAELFELLERRIART